MKKKITALALAAVMVLGLTACGGGAASSGTASTGAASSSTTDVAFVTDVGNIDDQSFNQYTWAGVQQFCDANGLNANYYKPSEDSDAARVEQMDNAVKDGAKVIVMAGYLFAPALEEAQAKYPDISFLALDVSTGDLAEPAANTALITYKEEQAGYLAGYAAVTDGYKNLSGLLSPDQAAADLGVSDVTIKYWYSGSFQANDDIKAKMDSWYSEGTEVVFACGGSICNSCVAAAQANNGKMIGVDVDQSPLDACVITSAMKALSNSVVVCLTDAQGNGWKFTDAYAGKETTLGAAEDCVGLPMETSQFTTFTQEKYDELYGKMASGELVIDNSSDAAVKPAVTNVTVDYQD